jgi:tRNA pseudouridine55 synthase
MKAAGTDGLLVLDKPGGMTSRAAVDRALGWFPRGTRVGHTGTLDPLATGVLVLCVGAATRLTEYVQDMAKTYRAGLLLGARSDTDDADGTVTPVAGARPPDRDTVLRQLEGFVGEIEQVPPAFSAAKVTGQRAYDLARKGEEVALKPRRVQVYGIQLLAYDYPRLDLHVDCGKGTYIRSLARDLGERLGCGALVEALRRTRVGPFQDGEAVGLEADAAAARQKLLPLAAAVAELPRVTLGEAQLRRLRQGQEIALSRTVLAGHPSADHYAVAVFDPAEKLVAVGLMFRPRHLLRPDKVLPESPTAEGPA